MDDFEAAFLPDGSCRWTEDTEIIWGSVREWALDWFAEWRGGEYGNACEFMRAACENAIPGVVDALIVLAETADGDADLLGWVGAGPLEDLVSHSGNGLQVLAEVDRAARQNPAFRRALGNVWLGSDVPAPVKARLAELGAGDL